MTMIMMIDDTDGEDEANDDDKNMTWNWTDS